MTLKNQNFCKTNKNIIQETKKIIGSESLQLAIEEKKRINNFLNLIPPGYDHTFLQSSGIPFISIHPLFLPEKCTHDFGKPNKKNHQLINLEILGA